MLDVLYSDDLVLVVSKPSGLLVHRHRGPREETLVAWVRDYLAADTAFPLHRLDRGTSGALLFARSAGVAAQLSHALARGGVEKHYLALVRGKPPEVGDIEHPIPRREGGPRVPARTLFCTRESRDLEPRTLSLVQTQPLSGRLHQVRRHLKHISHPLIGDTTWGKAPLNHAVAERYGLRRLALHAWQLSFAHPTTGHRVTVDAPLPPDLTGPLVNMGFSIPRSPRALGLDEPQR